MGQADPLGFGHQDKQLGIGVERPRSAVALEGKFLFLSSVDDLSLDIAAVVFIGEIHRIRADPLGVDHRDHPDWGNACESCAFGEIFQPAHRLASVALRLFWGLGDAEPTTASGTRVELGVAAVDGSGF